MDRLPEGYLHCETCLTYYLDCGAGCPLCQLQRAIERPEKADDHGAVWMLVDFLFDYPNSAGSQFEHWLATREDACAPWIQPILACMRDNHDEQLERYRAAGGRLEPDYLGLTRPSPRRREDAAGERDDEAFWQPPGIIPTVPGKYVRMYGDGELKVVRVAPHHLASPHWHESARRGRWSYRIPETFPYVPDAS